MKYYKLIDDICLGVITSHDMMKFQQKHNILLTCDESQAQYAQYEGNLFHANWMKPLTTNEFDCTLIDIIQISKEEYEILKSGNDVEEFALPIEPNENIQDHVVDNVDVATVEYLRNVKIKMLEEQCERAICNGIDVIMDDGISHHFSLTVQDQLNLIAAYQAVESGNDDVLYHADGEPYRYFSADEIKKIIQEANTYKTYNTVYLSSLKNYVLSLKTFEELSKIHYGMKIPKKYQSDILKSFV